MVTQLKDATSAAITGVELPDAAQSVLLDERCSPAAAVAVSLAIPHLMVSGTVAHLVDLHHSRWKPCLSLVISTRITTKSQHFPGCCAMLCASLARLRHPHR